MNTRQETAPLAYSVKEFCKLVGISPRTFYTLLKRGDGPPVARIGKRTLIRAAAIDPWLVKWEAQA
jgi:excisionase family DNA binding protein